MTLAMVEFFDAEHGGRNAPPLSGFRPQIEINGLHTSCTVDSADGAVTFEFGVKHKVLLRLMHPSHFPSTWLVGTTVHLFEGNKLIGSGEVIELSPDSD